MIDKTTAGITAEPGEVEAVLHNLCGYHLSEPDPVFRYQVLTREQVLYDALVAAIKRERGRALAELAGSGRTLTQVAELTNLGTRQRVQRLIAIARAAESAVAEVQAASREFEERLAAVEATLDEVVSGKAPPPGAGPGGPAASVPAPREPSDDTVAPASAASTGPESGTVVGVPVREVIGGETAPKIVSDFDTAWAEAGVAASAAAVVEPPVESRRPHFGAPDEVPDLWGDEPEAPAVLEPTQMLPALAASVHPTKEMPAAGDTPWWRRNRDNGAA